MPRKVKDTIDYSGFDELPEKVQEQAQQEYKAWELQSNLERINSIANYQASIINGVISKANEMEDRSCVFWEKNFTKEDLDKTIPYNGSTGKPYTNLDNILMRSVMAIENYKEPIFLTMNQANLLGGTLKKTGQKTRNGKDEYVKGIKIAQIRTEEFVPELNPDGTKKMTPVLDKEGKPVLDKNGEQRMKVAGEYKKLKEPVYESYSLYNIEQFDNLDRTKLKKIDFKPLEAKREAIAKNPETKLDYKLGMLKGKTGDYTLNNLYEFVKATQKGINFEPKIMQRPSINMSATKEFVNEKAKDFSRAM